MSEYQYHEFQAVDRPLSDAEMRELRAELAGGDHRALYLAWLLCVQNEELDDDAPEPPVPPGLVTPMLPALREYQLSIAAPAPPAGSFDAALAQRGRAHFEGKARCSSCHLPESAFTDVNRDRLDAPAETGMDPRYAQRTATKRYRTTPLRALWQHPPYFHDGSAATLAAVVDHYDRVLSLRLTAQEKAELTEYLKTLWPLDHTESGRE
jgi:hypothetical protein